MTAQLTSVITVEAYRLAHQLRRHYGPAELRAYLDQQIVRITAVRRLAAL